MIPTIRTPERKFGNIDAALYFLRSNRKNDYLIENPGKITVTGTGEFKFENHIFPIADCGMEKMLEILGIPKSFAWKIPDNLLVENVNRLFREREKGLLVRTQNVGGDDDEFLVTSVLPYHYYSCHNSWILEYFKKSGLESDGIYYSPKMLRIILTTGQKVELFPDDAVQLGYEITNSENGFFRLEANGYFNRLVCSNGLIVSNKIHDGTAFRLNKKVPRIEIEALIERALVKLDERSLDIVGRIRQMREIQIGEENILRVRRRVARYIGPDRAKREFGNFAANYYDIINKVTSFAQDQDSFIRRRELERYGGEILFNFVSTN